MYNDEIITEVWRNRDAFVAKNKYDLKKIIAYLKTRQNKPHFKIVDRRILNKSAASDHRNDTV